jgi:hypothetical protein
MCADENRVTVPEHILAEAFSRIDWVIQFVQNIDLPRTERVRAATTCFVVAQEHHESIVRLSVHQLFASSFALVRIAFDAYVRGVWLSLCATDREVEKFIAGKEPINIGLMVLEIEKGSLYDDSFLSSYKKQSYKWMCDFTHTGGLQVERWSGEEIAPNYPIEEVLEVIATSESISLLALLGIITLIEDREDLSKAIRKFKPVKDEVSKLHEKQRDFVSRFGNLEQNL